MTRSGLFAVCVIAAFGLATAACTERAIELWDHSHEFEGEGLGDSNRQTYANQIVNPEPVEPTEEEAAYDGTRAVAGVGRYKANKVTQPEDSGGSATATGGGGSK